MWFASRWMVAVRHFVEADTLAIEWISARIEYCVRPLPREEVCVEWRSPPFRGCFHAPDGTDVRAIEYMVQRSFRRRSMRHRRAERLADKEPEAPCFGVARVAFR